MEVENGPERKTMKSTTNRWFSTSIFRTCRSVSVDRRAQHAGRGVRFSAHMNAGYNGDRFPGCGEMLFDRMQHRNAIDISTVTAALKDILP